MINHAYLLQLSSLCIAYRGLAAYAIRRANEVLFLLSIKSYKEVGSVIWLQAWLQAHVSEAIFAHDLSAKTCKQLDISKHALKNWQDLPASNCKLFIDTAHSENVIDLAGRAY